MDHSGFKQSFQRSKRIRKSQDMDLKKMMGPHIWLLKWELRIKIKGDQKNPEIFTLPWN